MSDNTIGIVQRDEGRDHRLTLTQKRDEPCLLITAEGFAVHLINPGDIRCGLRTNEHSQMIRDASAEDSPPARRIRRIAITTATNTTAAVASTSAAPKAIFHAAHGLLAREKTKAGRE